MQQKQYREVVVKDLIDSEKAHVTELQGLVSIFLVPLEKSNMWVNVLITIGKSWNVSNLRLVLTDVGVHRNTSHDEQQQRWH